MNGFTKEWLQAALIRALRTVAQTAIATIGTSVFMSDVNWVAVLSASVLAGILSMLMAIAGLPEAQNDGTLIVDNSSEEKTNYVFEVKTPLDELPEKRVVRMKVDKTLK